MKIFLAQMAQLYLLTIGLYGYCGVNGLVAMVSTWLGKELITHIILGQILQEFTILAQMKLLVVQIC